jgi:hypothetical protein
MKNHLPDRAADTCRRGVTLTVTCFEFWEYFTKGIEGRKATIKLSPGLNGTLKIDGEPYLRCKAKSGRIKH